MDTQTFYTSISPAHKRKVLFRGTLFAIIGLMPMLYASLFLDVKALSAWGWLNFVWGIGWIAAGMIPYKRLSKLERTPNKIVLSQDGSFRYCVGDAPVLNLKAEAISDVSFTEQRGAGGATVVTKEGKCFHLPFFNQRTCSEISQIIRLLN